MSRRVSGADLHLRAQRNKNAHCSNATNSGLTYFAFEEAAVVHGLFPSVSVVHIIARGMPNLKKHYRTDI